MSLIDISPLISTRSAVFPGDSPLTVEWTMQVARGDSCSVARLTMSPHTGAHVDAPAHVLADPPEGTGERPRRVGELALETFIGPCRVFSTPKSAPIGLQLVEALPLAGVTRVLFRTRDRPDPTVFPEDGAYFEADAAAYLAARAVLIGIDTASVDHWQSKELPAHRAFFAGGAVVLEGLDLSAAAPGDYELIALPLRFSELDGSPVRAVLRTVEGSPRPS